MNKECLALDFSAGMGALEEGDDRLRPAVLMQVGLSNNWISKMYFWGRKYGPVTQTDGILAIGRRVDVFGSKSLHGSLGMSGMMEKTSITYKSYPESNSSDTSSNLGLMLGLSYEIFNAKNVSLTASWDSHVFAAGSAVIFLVTGRKQFLGLTAGVSF